MEALIRPFMGDPLTKLYGDYACAIRPPSTYINCPVVKSVTSDAR